RARRRLRDLSAELIDVLIDLRIPHERKLRIDLLRLLCTELDFLLRRHAAGGRCEPHSDHDSCSVYTRSHDASPNRTPRSESTSGAGKITLRLKTELFGGYLSFDNENWNGIS